MLGLKIASVVFLFSWLQIIANSTTWLEMTDRWQCTNDRSMHELRNDVKAFCTKKYRIKYREINPNKQHGEQFGNPNFRLDTIGPMKGRWFK